MVAVPELMAVTTPLLTVATEASDVLQVTVEYVASLGLTVAVRIAVSPTFIDIDSWLTKTPSTSTIGISVGPHDRHAKMQIANDSIVIILCDKDFIYAVH
jgi:hypothetical protein